MTLTNAQWQEAIVQLANSTAGTTDIIATGTLTAAQATAGTPVVGGTVSITLGTGQSVVEAQLTGTFNAGTTVLFEGTDDVGVTTNWLATFGQDTGVTNASNITSIAGGASKIIRIGAAGFQQIRVRASVFAGGDSVSVRLIGSTGGGGGGGGTVTVANANANGQATMANSAPVTIASDQTSVAFNITKVNSATLSSSNSLPTLSNLQQFILDGKAYVCSTGKVTGAANLAASWFSANTSAKNKLVWSVRVSYSNATQSVQFTYLTTDDTNITAGTSDITNALNMKYGGGAVEAATAMHHASAVASTSGTLMHFEDTPTNNLMELLSPGQFLYIPSGTAGGVGVYQATTAAGSWCVTVKWIEY